MTRIIYQNSSINLAILTFFFVQTWPEEKGTRLTPYVLLGTSLSDTPTLSSLIVRSIILLNDKACYEMIETNDSILIVFAPPWSVCWSGKYQGKERG